MGVTLWIAEAEEEVLDAFGAFYLAAEFFVVVNRTGAGYLHLAYNGTVLAVDADGDVTLAC